MNVPCFNCTDRCTGCHDTCEKYQAYRKHRQAISDARAKQNFLQDYFRDSVNKSVKLRSVHG